MVDDRRGGGVQFVAVRGPNVYGIDPTESPTILWEHKIPGGTIAMPLTLDGDRVFVSTAGDDGCEMIHVNRNAETNDWSVESLWANRDMRNHFNSSIYRQGFIYGFDNATLKCLSAETGEVQWAKRGLGKGSLLLAGDDLVVLTDQGEVRLVSATPEDYVEKGSMQVLEGKSWTAPSLAAGRLLVRNLEQAACLSFEG